MMYYMAIAIITLSLPFMLLLGGLLNIPPGFRLKSSAVSMLFAWLAFCVDTGATLIQVGAGTLWLLAVIVVGFMFWSVLCWGYTISMLVCLADQGEVPDLQTWERAYAGNEGIRGMTVNRASVLVWLRLAKADYDSVVLTRFGWIMAIFIRTGSQLVGV